MIKALIYFFVCWFVQFMVSTRGYSRFPLWQWKETIIITGVLSAIVMAIAFVIIQVLGV